MLLSGDLFTELDYADDIAVPDTDLAHLVHNLEQVEDKSSSMGLHLSWSKIKIQNMAARPPASD